MEFNVLGFVLKLIEISINSPIHNFKILAQRPVINQLKLMQTKTSLKTTKKLQSAVFLWSCLVF